MTTTAPDASRQDKYREFVTWVEKRCAEDPGVRVALRRGLRRELDDVRGMHRIVAAWVREGCPEAEERAYYAVAAMIADRPRHAYASPETDDGADPEPVDPDEATPKKRPRRDSLGASYARAVLAQAGRGLREENAEARLNLLTRQSLTGLHRHLPGNVRHLRDTGTEIDFAALLHDLASWPRFSKPIARRWLQDYYRTRKTPIENAAKDQDLDAPATDA
ncbi:hypothetical protein SRB5_53390 [Streptomyces sp. RB5]|uniref:Type I-E CRISPR-associated protein Cse2/CasB n=1 Tax=Streptomyces smaragdinus TaxID=2585196 RepID=A0A7K0CP29_9ACTN|nr:type I-E CRISPR-associated protein Cse2/CasB [Streptomyces smaragdinus]MQY15161.1 hypothetical protein [Streptomyces smaragdinus]